MAAQAIAIALLISTGTGGALGNMFGGGNRTFVAQDRMFALAVPSGWEVLQGTTPGEIQLLPQGPGDPMLFVRRIQVPEGADPMQLALRAIDLRLSKMPGFKLGAKRRVKMAGHPAASLAGHYAFQGNIQFPRAIEEVYLVVGNEAFVFHFECFSLNVEAYIADLSAVYASFVPRPAEAPGPAASETAPEVENIPF